MIEKIVVDSSVWVAFFAFEEPYNANSEKFIEWVFKNRVKVVMLMIVLFETFHTLRRLGWLEDVNSYKKFNGSSSLTDKYKIKFGIIIIFSFLKSK